MNANPSNPVIGVRSVGADPDLVDRHTAACVTGLRAAGVAACGKHFPGHGDTAVDSLYVAAFTPVANIAVGDELPGAAARNSPACSPSPRRAPSSATAPVPPPWRSRRPSYRRRRP